MSHRRSKRLEPLAEGITGFDRAMHRVGSDERKHLSWLLDFLHLSAENLAALSATERTKWRRAEANESCSMQSARSDRPDESAITDAHLVTAVMKRTPASIAHS